MTVRSVGDPREPSDVVGPTAITPGLPNSPASGDGWAVNILERLPDDGLRDEMIDGLLMVNQGLAKGGRWICSICWSYPRTAPRREEHHRNPGRCGRSALNAGVFPAPLGQHSQTIGTAWVAVPFACDGNSCSDLHAR